MLVGEPPQTRLFGTNLTTGFICTDTLIILDSPLCEGVFRSEKLSVPKKSNWKTGLFLDCTNKLRFVYYQ